MIKGNSIPRMMQLLRAELGRLTPGDRLPSVRDLMAKHRVSPVTVRRAIAALADEGLIDPRPGHGTFVAHRQEPPAAPDCGWQAGALGGTRMVPALLDMLAPVARPGAIDLAGGYPPSELQALPLVTAAMARAIRRPGVWGRMSLEGLEPLRTWFARQAGGSVAPHEVIICPGSQSAIATTFGALAAPGSSLLIESPTYLGAILAAQAAGLNLVPVPCDREGVRPEALAEAMARTGARLAYLQPTFANPAGTSLTPDRRRQVLEVAGQFGAILIEDDWGRDLALVPSPPAPLVAADSNGHVVCIRSITKSTAPGLRIGAIIARGAVLARLAASRSISDFFVPGPIQEAAVETLHSPGWARHLKLLRTALLERRDAMVAAVRRQLGEESLTTIPLGGMYLWVRLPDPVDDVALAARLAAGKVIVSPGRRWFPAEPTGTYLRLSYAGAPPDLIARGVTAVARAIG
jgi:DNA-binding transcriptional MocR family regulator